MSRELSAAFAHNTVAIVYDFDGTLTPQPMQEYTVLPQLGVVPRKFWNSVQADVEKNAGDEMLTYMRLLIEQIESQKQHLSRADLRRMATAIHYFPGVKTWFDRINRYVDIHSRGAVKVRHYIISAGLKEILEGIDIRDHFHRIFASEYVFNHHDVAVFPKVVINDTVKTQFIFRINKGREDLRQNINEYMPEEDRPIPFSNIIYLGDGLTDVPSMTLTKKNGGYSVAIQKPRVRRSIQTCRRLLDAGRVDFYAIADYRPGKVLERRIRLILNIIIAQILYRKEMHGD
jgi:2-hydroxy-3-keto-5-methylthiopentenyl-1-phosphate phosphatase